MTPLAKLIREAARESYHSEGDVFRDFVEMSALSMSNTVDLRQKEAREKRYLEIMNESRYSKLETRLLFPRMHAALVDAFEDEITDHLGRTIIELEVRMNDRLGQVFTPFAISRLVAEMTIGDPQELIGADGFFRMNEPACGSGSMVLAVAAALRAKGFNPQKVMHVTATDIDIHAVHMAYVQLSLCGIPAVVVHGNSLTLEEWSHWYTPFHVLWNWGLRLRMAQDRPKQLALPNLRERRSA